jgi:predicted Ser/Thr protein kinase
MTCPDANLIAAFVEGTLDPARADELAGHVDSCGTCDELVRWSTRAAMSTARSSPSMLPDDVEIREPGSTFGRYVLLDLIGSGGMGMVYAAFDPKLDRKVALKLVWDDDAAARDDIEREARLAARLQHPNIIAIYDVGAVNERVYLAMEFVDGVTLAEWMSQRRSQRDVLGVFQQAARGLAAAHDAGLIHRDFKPSNVLVGNDGRVRVLDFGLARAIDDGPDRTAGARIGSPAYMAPEQHRGESAGPAADQFAFCVALHEALYGTRPFDGVSLDDLAANVGAGRVIDPPRPSRVPPWLRRVILRGLEVEPERRFASVEALATALRRDPTRARRLAIAAVAVVAIAGLGFANHARTVHEHAVSCEADEQRVLDLVGPGPAQRIRAGFAATGAPFAASSTDRALAALDHYAQTLGRSYHDSCIAGGPAIEPRVTCYEERVAELDALVGAFSTPDRLVVARATTAVGRLTPVTACEDARVPTVPDGATPDLGARMARAQSIFRAGRLAAARDEATQILAASRARRDRRHEMDALLLLGQLDIGSKPIGATTLASAIDIGEALGRDADIELALEALAYDAAQRSHDYDAAHRFQRLAAAKLERAGLTDKRAGDVIALDGMILQMEDHLGPAEAALRQALALQQTSYGADSPSVMLTLDRLGMVLGSQGRDREALALDERAARIRDAVYGPDHPRQVDGLIDLAGSLNAVDRHDEALAKLRRADDIALHAYGADSAERFYTLDNIGITEKNRGNYAAARTALESAQAIAEHALGNDSAEAGEVLADLAEVDARSGQVADSAALYERALAIVEHALGSEHRTVADILVGLGQSYVELHRAAEAVPVLERALRLRADDTPAKSAAVRFSLARALWDASVGDRPRAVTLARQAAATPIRAGEGVTHEQVTAWLAAHAPT